MLVTINGMQTEVYGTLKCSICFGENDEMPPSGDEKDAKEWICPCTCSFVSHASCFYSFVSSEVIDNRKLNGGAIAQVNPAEMERFMNRNDPCRILAAEGDNFAIYVKCPQCRGPLSLRPETSKLLNIKNKIDSSLSSIFKIGLTSTMVVTSMSSLMFGGIACVSCTGVYMANALMPNSIQSALFQYKPTRYSLVQAVDQNSITVPKFLLSTSIIPISLFHFRHMSVPFALRIVLKLTEFSVFVNSDLLRSNRPLRWTLYLDFIKELYCLGYSLTFNRVYYRWAKKIRPGFLPGKTALSQQLETESNIEENDVTIEMENETKKDHKNMGILSAIFYLLPKVTYALKLFPIYAKRFFRETVECLMADFSEVFSKKDTYLFVGSTLVWPYVGSYLGAMLLKKIPMFQQLMNSHSTTPDEATYLANLIGCIAVAVLKDFAQLLFDYKTYKCLRSLRTAVVKPLNMHTT